MKTIVLTNEKGGVGKTTLSLHLAAGLAIRGARVLLIDADAQGHIGHQLALPEFGGLYRLLAQEASWRDVVMEADPIQWAPQRGADGRLMVLQSNIETRGLAIVLGDMLALRERLAEVESHFDFCVIDTAPTPSLLHAVLYLAADYSIVPVKPEMLSLDGLAKTALHMKQLRETRRLSGLPSLRLLGIAPTMVRDTSSHAFGLTAMEDKFGSKSMLPALSLRTIWTDREYARRTIYSYAPGDVAALEMDSVVEAVMKRMRHEAAA
jgi:chromosome partitioning protein